MRRMTILTCAVALVLLVPSSPALARGLNCVVADAEGDALWQFSTDNIEVQSYRDIVQIELAKVGRSVFTFAMDMAGEVPAQPAFLLPSVSLMFWSWTIDTDPTTAPAGFPVAPGIAEPFEFVVRLVWDGGSFRGELVDRRPLLTGGSALVRPVPFKISKSTVSVSVDGEAIGNPAGFRWGAVTNDWLVDEQGNNGSSPLDVVPGTNCPVI